MEGIRNRWEELGGGRRNHQQVLGVPRSTGGVWLCQDLKKVLFFNHLPQHQCIY